MPIFKRKIPPFWYVMYPSPPSSSTPPKRDGPYTRATVIQLLADGALSDGALVWTNERIFPNPEKPLSARMVRIPDWRRLDQLPDPVYRQLLAAAQARPPHPEVAPQPVEPASAEDAPLPLTNDQIHKIQQQPPSHPPPPPPAGGQPGGHYPAHQIPPQHAPAAGAYPAGTYTADQHYQAAAPAPDHQPAPAPPPHSAYPQPSAYPAGAYSQQNM